MHQVALYITTVFDMKKQVLLMNIKITKGEFILFFASKYDPLGLINRFVVSFKCLFQKVCISKVNFDAILPPNILKVWRNMQIYLVLIDWLYLGSQVETQRKLNLEGTMGQFIHHESHLGLKFYPSNKCQSQNWNCKKRRYHVVTCYNAGSFRVVIIYSHFIHSLLV